MDENWIVFVFFMFPQWDFTLLNGMLFVLLFVLIIYGIILIFIRSYVSGPSFETLRGLAEYQVKCWLCGWSRSRHQMGETCKDPGGREVCDRIARGDKGCKSCQNTTAHVSPGGGEGSKRGSCWMSCRLRRLWQAHQGVLGLPGRLCCPSSDWQGKAWPRKETAVGLTARPPGPWSVTCPSP